MRLFLSSQDLGKYAERAVKLAGDNRRLALVRNAQDDKLPEERNFNTPVKRKMFLQAGFTDFEEIDLRDYFGKSEALAEKLKSFGSVWCAGGNTFILRRAMRASGFDKIITSRLEEDSILYGGWSAGSCICAPSLHGIEYGDQPEPEAVPRGYPAKEIIWDGLGLVPFMIVPHCDQEWFQKSADQAILHLKKRGAEYRPLNDGQVIVVDGGNTELLA
jgi:dipeptidase E